MCFVGVGQGSAGEDQDPTIRFTTVANLFKEKDGVAGDFLVVIRIFFFEAAGKAPRLARKASNFEKLARVYAGFVSAFLDTSE